MADELDSFQDNLIPGVAPTPQAFPAIIIQQPFSLEAADKEALKKLRDEILDKVHTSETDMSDFYSQYSEYVDSYRITPSRRNAARPKGLSNAKSGETHRATETLATVTVRMLTASDPWFMAIAEGLDMNGQQISEAQLFAIESLMRKQHTALLFKPTLYRGMNSTYLFGSAIFENSWEQMFNVDGSVYLEGTKLRLRSLLTTFFDTTCEDIGDSDFIATVDYPSLWRLKRWIDQDPEDWDRSVLSKEILDASKFVIDGRSQSYSRLTARRERAGYGPLSQKIRELLTYHGKLDINNSVIQQYWESLGHKTDPNKVDFTVGILDDSLVGKFHTTQYGDWKTKFQWAHYKSFELEPLAYGVGRLARTKQRELDLTASRAQDILFFALHNMFAIDRFANVKQEQLVINPNAVIDVDGPPADKIMPLRPDIAAITQALAMMGVTQESLRSDTGAGSSLQAQITKATATESSLTQAEAIRGIGVHAELIAETLLQRFLKQCHINNYYHLDSDIWLYVTGTQKPEVMNKNKIPFNIGYEIKVTTDKDYRPERIQKVLEGLKLATGFKTIIPEAMNLIRPLLEEYFRDLGINPRTLSQPVSVKDQMSMLLQRRMTASGGAPLGDGADGTEIQSEITTPVGQVPTSPISPAYGSEY